MTAGAKEGRRPPRYLEIGDRIWPALHGLTAFHVWLYRVSRGRLDAMPGVRGGKVLLLDHVGAKSGTKRTAPLLYTRDGDDLLIVASKGGFPKHPAWYHNLVANPDTALQIGSEKRQVHARVVTDPIERERLWGLAVKTYAGYEDYAARSKGREIPLVVLEPRN
jgi:deazaflavin-dependent oxidoreductase (nitroreductase family)